MNRFARSGANGGLGKQRGGQPEHRNEIACVLYVAFFAVQPQLRCRCRIARGFIQRKLRTQREEKNEQAQAAKKVSAPSFLGRVGLAADHVKDRILT